MIKRVTPEQIKYIVQKRKFGKKSYAQIGEELGLADTTVGYIYNKHKIQEPKCQDCEMLLSSKFHQQFPCDKDFMIF